MAPLSSLTCLLLNNNQLRQLPNSLSSLRALEHLSCSYNWLGGMGPSLPLLCGLPRLRRLELACVSDVRCRLVPPQVRVCVCVCAGPRIKCTCNASRICCVVRRTGWHSRAVW